MKVKIFPTILVSTKYYLSTQQENREHRARIIQALEEIKFKNLPDDMIAALIVKRFNEDDEKTSDWNTYIILPNADKPDRQLVEKVSRFLIEKGYGCGEDNLAGMTLLVINSGSKRGLKKLLKEL